MAQFKRLERQIMSFAHTFKKKKMQSSCYKKKNWSRRSSLETNFWKKEENLLIEKDRIQYSQPSQKTHRLKGCLTVNELTKKDQLKIYYQRINWNGLGTFNKCS